MEGAERLAAAWLRGVRDPAVVAELEAIYQYVADATEARRPVCRASGRCCKFEEWGHRLYVTGLEAAYTVSRLSGAAPALYAESLAAAQARGGCPFQVERLCEAHAIRPLGCRIYFCDSAAQAWQEDLYERMQQQLRALHERAHIEYRYGEWRQMLAILMESAAQPHAQ
jgi:Fe-S-cluster containining protein